MAQRLNMTPEELFKIHQMNVVGGDSTAGYNQMVVDDEKYLNLAQRYADGDLSVENELRAMVQEQATRNGFDSDVSFRMDHQAPYKDDEDVNKSADDLTELFGDDIYEWGYDIGKDTLRSKIHDREKLPDLITYDENGSIIPLSQRFNPKKESIYYQATIKQRSTKAERLEKLRKAPPYSYHRQ